MPTADQIEKARVNFIMEGPRRYGLVIPWEGGGDE